MCKSVRVWLPYVWWLLALPKWVVPKASWAP